MKNLIILTLVGSLTALSAFAQNELFKPSHGGEELKKSGMSYEVVRKPKEILVYPPKKAGARVPSVVTLKFKNKKGDFDHLDLKLIPTKEPGMNIYSAPLPARVLITGGVSFDLNFNDKK